MNGTLKTYTNGNREIEITTDGVKFYVASNVFNGVDWHYGHRKPYKTLKNAEKAAAHEVAEISKGWTQNPTWTIEPAQA